MAELTTIARPYAEAAFSLARDQNALPVWSQMLKLASRVVGDARVADALDNPKLDAPAKESLLLSICGDGLDAEGRNFVRVLVEADRIALMPAIAALFETLKDEADGVAKATIESRLRAFATKTRGPDHRARAPLQAEGRGDGGRRIRELIGGARITVGDNVIDGTVQELARDGSAAAQLTAT